MNKITNHLGDLKAGGRMIILKWTLMK